MSWAVWITGPPSSGKSAIAQAAAAELRTGGESVVLLELDEIRKVLVPESACGDDAEREAVHRALVYMAAALVDAGVPVIVDAAVHAHAGPDLARATIPRFAEVQVRCPTEVGAAPARTRPARAGSGGNAEAGHPELAIDPATQTVAEAAADVVDLVRRSLRAARRQTPTSSSLAHEELCRRVKLAEGDTAQRAIARRAFAYAATLLNEASTRREGIESWCARAREEMVQQQVIGRGVQDPAVVGAMRRVRRELFVPRHLARRAYADAPLAIGQGQTISQPCVVAAMVESLRLRPSDRVLEIGTGSGYGAAVLAEIAAEVYTIERLKGLAESAKHRLAALGYGNVHVRDGDGSLGCPEQAPFDAIVVTAGGPDVPPSLLQQLAEGGRLVMPVGRRGLQQLVRVTRTHAGTYEREGLGAVRFVPLIGAEGWPDRTGAS